MIIKGRAEKTVMSGKKGSVRSKLSRQVPPCHRLVLRNELTDTIPLPALATSGASRICSRDGPCGNGEASPQGRIRAKH